MKKLFLMIVMLFSISLCFGKITITQDGNGIVSITQESNKEIGLVLQNNTLSATERQMITSATGFELVGPFSKDPDFLQLASTNSTITSLDLSDCQMETNFQLPTEWKETLTTINLPTNEGFNTLHENFLYGFSQINQIVIPSNIKTIESGALGNMNITSITIPATVETIKSGAFKETTTLKDVYAESRETVCEMNAFDFMTLVAQTQIANIYTNAAKLHYPKADYEYFVGSWKEGRTLSQDNLNGFKDGLYEKWFGFTRRVGPNNGWQQFALSDNSEPFPMIKGDIRTYSDSKEHDYLPTGYDLAIRVYRVTGYNKNGNAILQRVRGSFYYNCIPKNTGVLLYVYIRDDGKSYLHYFENTNNNITQYPWYWKGSNEDNAYGTNNLLEKSITPTEVHPVWPWPKTIVEYRNFGLFIVNNEYRWVRLTSSTLRANRAYLKMPANVFTNSNEGIDEGPGNTSFDAKAYTMFEEEGQTCDTQDENNEIQYVGLEFPEEDDVLENFQSEMHFLYANPEDCIEQNGIATQIENTNIRLNNKIYTLQGIEINNPSRGMYIKNGKKYIIK